MIANTSHLPFEVRLVPQQDCPERVVFPQFGSPYCVLMNPLTGPFGAPCAAPPWSTLSAVDLESGDIMWQVPFGTAEGLVPWPFYHFVETGIQMGGPAVTAGGVIFIGASMDGYIRAFDVDTGAELWEAKLPTSGNGVPMTYMYEGTQYVVIAAGGHWMSPLPASDHLIAFKLADR